MSAKIYMSDRRKDSANTDAWYIIYFTVLLCEGLRSNTILNAGTYMPSGCLVEVIVNDANL